MGFWPIVQNIIRNSDIVLLMVDARMPEISRNSEIINKATNLKKCTEIIFNKTDLVSKEEIENLKKEYPYGIFISCKNKKGIKDLKISLENRAENWIKPSLRVGVVGYPNVGKSSLINLLAPQAKAKVSKVSGTTKTTQWTRIGRIRIMDSPGVIPFSDKKIQVGMVAAKDPHKIKDPEKVAIRIIEFLRKKDKKILEQFYNTEADTDYELFLAIGKKKCYLTKGGEVDENRTAIKILEDWQQGKIKIK